MYKGKKIVALCMARVHDKRNVNYVKILWNKLNEMNCMLLIYTICSDLIWYNKEYNLEELEARSDLSVFSLLEPEILDAVIVLDDCFKVPSITQRIIDSVSPSGIPVIVVDGKYENTVFVGFDYLIGLRKLVSHITDIHKAEKYCIIAGTPDSPFSNDRVDAIMEVLESKGIEKGNIIIKYGFFWTEPAKMIAEEMVRSGDLPDAIICLNDVMAVAVCTTFEILGVNVPDDVIVTGFDGYDEVFLTHPRISTCICDNSDLSDQIVLALKDAFAGKPSDSYLAASRSVIQESCGCRKKSELPFDIYEHFSHQFYRLDDEERDLTDMASKIQMSDSLEEAAGHWRDNIKYNITALINNDLISGEYTTRTVKDPFSDIMTVFSDRYKTQHLYEFSRKDIVPGFESFVDEGIPLVFSAVEYSDVPAGFICFNFDPGDAVAYARIPNFTYALSRSVGVFRSIREQIALREKLELVYITDALTGLYNRNGLLKYFSDMTEKLKAENGTITSVMCDLDRLKYINDKFGHAEGDNAIRTVALALKHSVPEYALCIRFGGDEISAFIPEKTDPEKLADRMHSYFAEYNSSSDKEYSVWASIGCYITDKKEEFGYEYLIKMADEQLYIDKEKNHKLR